MWQKYLIKYAEIGLKGKNRYKFEDALILNIKNALEGFDYTNIYKEQERIYIDFDKEHDEEKLIDKLKSVFGIWTISPMYKIDFTEDYNILKNEVLKYVNKLRNDGDNINTFKIKTKRINKKFPMHSDDISKELGHDILENNTDMKVDVHNPSLLIRIEIRKNINIYSKNIKGLGGLPLGTGGKSLLLLSGGIDSPVAGYMIAKRGVNIEAIYFDAPPYTSDRARQKVIDLKNILKNYIPDIKLHIINFTKAQLDIYEKCPHEELTIIMRRLMMMISEKIANNINALALITGESIGQVASQTVPSLVATNESVSLPVFRPLIGFDKEEIIDKAKEIGTFETSILPYEDCCTIFVAKHPVTSPKLDVIKKSELKLDNINELINDCINNDNII